jgi:hypothetical protein
MDILCALLLLGGAVALVLLVLGVLIAVRPSPQERIIRYSQTIVREAEDQIRVVSHAHLNEIAKQTGSPRRYHYTPQR